MDTGLYFGIRFFEDANDLPELSLNRKECLDYVHMEYVNLPPNEDKLLPFGFKLPFINTGFFADSVVLTLHCSENNALISEITTFVTDWITHEDETEAATWIYYLAKDGINSSENIAPGKYYLKISFLAKGEQFKFYSDIIIVNKFITSSTPPVFYSITYSVTGADEGTLSATRGGLPVASGGSVSAGSTVILTASPNSGHEVKEWIVNGNIVQTGGATLNVVMNEDKVVTVEFEAISLFLYTVTLFKQPNLGGSLFIDNAPYASPINYEENDPVEIHTEAAETHDFLYWVKDDMIISANETYNFNMPAENVSFYAIFALKDSDPVFEPSGLIIKVFNYLPSSSISGNIRVSKSGFIETVSFSINAGGIFEIKLLELEDVNYSTLLSVNTVTPNVVTTIWSRIGSVDNAYTTDNPVTVNGQGTRLAFKVEPDEAP